MTSISNTPISDFDAAVRLISGGTNVAIYNDLGLPSIYVRRDRGLISDVITGGPEEVHPAFIVDGSEVPAFYMGKYLATVYKGRALSLPLQDPAANKVDASNKGSAVGNNVNFDNAKIWCEANGAGFHLPTIAEYAWIALLSRMNGTMPNGNNNYGAASEAACERGVASYYGDGNNVYRTLTGSGPATWNDTHRPDGICDLNGNVYEWQGGYRTVDGELQILPDNDAAMQYSQAAGSALWKAILQDGTLAAPGTAGSLKWDYTTNPGTSTGGIPFRLNTTIVNRQTIESTYGHMSLSNLTAAEGVNVPLLLKALALMPDGTSGSYGSDYVYMKNIDERMTERGGNWYDSGRTGVFCWNSLQRSYNSTGVGFRPAFIPGI